MSKIQVDTIDTRSGTSTMQIGSTNTSTITLGVSGDTINVPSGVTIANAGTATGFGGVNTPYFIAKRGTSNQTISNAANTVVQFNNEIIDSDSCYNVSTYTFQPNVAGVYYLAGSIAWGSTADWDNTEIGLYKNGSTDIDKMHFSNRFYSKGSVETIISLTTSDQITMKVYQSSGSDKDILYGNWGYFMGYRLIS